MDYIFGYGSLICADSRSRTGITATAHPIEVEGISRKWSVHTPEWEATALNAHIDDRAECNGVYFQVDLENLQLFDLREQGYKRIALNWSKVKPLSNQPLPTDGTLWVYVGNNVSFPTTQKPIMHSYLDVILNGCLDISPEFAQRFTQLTDQWQHLVNDRASPEYPRPLKSTDRHTHIDDVIQNNLPNLWHHRSGSRHH